MSRDPNDESLSSLRARPSVRRWSLLMKRALAGKLTGKILAIGNLEDFVSTIISDSERPNLSSTLFKEALESEVASWIPSALDTRDQLAMYLDLIAAYSPKGGYSKVIAKLRDLDSNPSLFHKPSHIDYSYNRDLRKKALNTLANYFPEAEPGRDSAYKAFIKILRNHLLVPGYAGHAAKILLRRGKLDFRSPSLRRIIRNDPTCLSSLLQEAVSTRSQLIAESSVKSIYGHAEKTGPTFQSFNDAILRIGGRLEYTKNKPILHYPGLEPIELDLPTNVISRSVFWANFSKGTSHEWSKKIPELRRQVFGTTDPMENDRKINAQT